MAADRLQNLQDTFLNHVRKNKTPLTIFLVNGVKLQGVVTWFDNFCVLLRRDGHSQLVYKHAISTIMPGHPIQLFEGAEESPAGWSPAGSIATATDRACGRARRPAGRS
jgi:host factor-I protein